MMSKTIKLSCARRATRVIKHAMTLLELMLVVALIASIGSLGIITSVRFWRAYQLDQAQAALERFLQQIEIIGTITQADLSLEFLSNESGGVSLRLTTYSPIPLPKISCHVEIAGLDRIEYFLEGEKGMSETLIWSYGQTPQTLRLQLITHSGKRDIVLKSNWQRSSLKFLSYGVVNDRDRYQGVA